MGVLRHGLRRLQQSRVVRLVLTRLLPLVQKLQIVIVENSNAPDVIRDMLLSLARCQRL